jgi:hypothetical protein
LPTMEEIQESPHRIPMPRVIAIFRKPKASARTALEQ